MKLAPSFYALYRRSRYARTEEDDVTTNRQNRRELFAVAAVALALKHDKAFRDHFIENVCGLANVRRSGNFDIAVQPYSHADLELRFVAEDSLIIIEFKVGAPLEKKQNPGEDSVFFGKGGYGKAILRQKFSRKRYIVVDDFPRFQDGTRKGIHCLSRTWNALTSSSANGLWADLLDSLGELGIPAFRFKWLKSMKMLEHTKHAVTMHQILTAVASAVKMTGDKGMDISAEGDAAWYGRTIPRDFSPGFDELARLVQSSGGKAMGWFGYQSGPKRSELAVWFYCGSARAAKNTRLFLEQRLDGTVPGKVDVEKMDVFFQGNPPASSGDAEWFNAVFRNLRDRQAKQPPQSR